MATATALEVQTPVVEFQEQSISMVQQIAQAQIQSAYVWAERHPRDWDVIEQQILKECRRPKFVEIDPDPKKYGSSTAMYGVPRGGSYVDRVWVPDVKTGFTIRFVEMALPFLKNIEADLWPLGEDDTQRIFRAVRIDYESNNIESEIIIVPKTVERSRIKDTDFVLSQRTNSDGKPVYIIRATNDEIDNTKKALYAKAKRGLVLSIIPGWLKKAAEEEIRATQRQVDAQDPDAARKRLYAGFAKVGVSVDELKAYIGHGNDLNPAEMENLRVLYAGIAEGHTTWKEILAAKEQGGDEDLDKVITELFTELGETPARARKMKGQYVGRPKELIAYLQDLVAKKRNDGSQKEPSVADPSKTTQSTVQPTESGSQGGTPEKSVPSTQQTGASEKATAQPTGDLFQQDIKGPATNGKPAPPPVDESGW